MNDFFCWLRVLTLLLILSFSTIASSHNKVVVIPMAGEDVPAEIIPSAPITNVNTSTDNYVFQIALTGGTFPIFIDLLTATDKTTSLMWQRQDDATGRTWDGAWDYCANLELSGQNDWRLPTIVELMSIVDYGAISPPTIDNIAFINTRNRFYWSSTGYVSDSSRAWAVNFFSGNVISVSKASFDADVRCVR